MPIKFEVQCCEGESREQCLKDLCPHYSRAESEVRKDWPWLSTGFGNAYGNPKMAHFLEKVRRNLREAQEKQSNAKKDE